MPKTAPFFGKAIKIVSALGAPPPTLPIDIRRLWAPSKIFRVVTHTYYCKLSQRMILYSANTHLIAVE